MLELFLLIRLLLFVCTVEIGRVGGRRVKEELSGSAAVGGAWRVDLAATRPARIQDSRRDTAANCFSKK